MAEPKDTQGTANVKDRQDVEEAQEAVRCGSCSSLVKYFCLTCSVRLCDNCKSLHEKTHRIVLFTKKYSRDLELCPTHKQVFQAFCKTCDDLTCIKCILSKHKGHALIDIEERFEEEKMIFQNKTQEIKATALRGIRLSMEKNKKNNSDLSQRFSEMREAATNDARFAIQTIEQGLQEHLSKINDLERDSGSFLADQQNALQKQYDVIENEVKSREQRLKDANPASFLLGLKSHEKTKTDFTKIAEGVIYPLPTFERKSTDKSSKRTLLEACGRISSVGFSTMEREMLQFVPPPLAKYWRDDIEVVKTLSMTDIVQGDCLRHVRHTKNGNIWIADKGTAYQIKEDGSMEKKIIVTRSEQVVIDSMCSDVNGYLIISHFCAGTCQDPDFIRNVETTTSMPLQSLEIPNGICLMDNKIVALMYTVGIGSKLKLKYYNDDGNAEGTKATLDKKLNTLLLSKKLLINQTYPCCLSFNPYNKQVVISNSQKAVVVVCCLEGKYQFQYDGKHPYLAEGFGPQSVECDQYGHVLIADLPNHCIHMLNSKGQFLTFIASKEQGLYHPFGLSVDYSGLLWVTNYNNKTIKVIKYLEKEIPLKEQCSSEISIANNNVSAVISFQFIVSLVVIVVTCTILSSVYFFNSVDRCHL